MQLFFTLRSSVSETADADIAVFGSSGFAFRGFYPGYTQATGDPNILSWSIVKMQPGNAAGNITLRSSDPRQVPAIDFHYFEQQADRDIQAISECMDYLHDVMDTLDAPWAPLEVLQPEPDVERGQAIRDHAFGHHVTSSCRMGPRDDPEYCVDSEFRVNSVEGLRVVDASIFPRTPGGFPTAPIFTVSQKAFRTIMAGLEG